MVEQAEQFESGDELPLFSREIDKEIDKEIDNFLGIKEPVEDSKKSSVEESKLDKQDQPSKIATSFPHMERPRKSLAQMAAEAQQESTQGKIECPHCGCQDFRTTNTKVVDGFRKRLRRCRHCGYPLNTIEFVLRD